MARSAAFEPEERGAVHCDVPAEADSALAELRAEIQSSDALSAADVPLDVDSALSWSPAYFFLVLDGFQDEFVRAQLHLEPADDSCGRYDRCPLAFDPEAHQRAWLRQAYEGAHCSPSRMNRGPHELPGFVAVGLV